MADAIVINRGNPETLAKLQPLADSAREYVEAARSPRTRDAYRQQWQAFCAWCASHELAAMPAAPETVALYLTARAQKGRKVATLAQALAAISEAHQLAGHQSPRSAPAVREVWKGIRRTTGVAPRRVAPVLVDELAAVVAALPAGLLGIRNRALLTVGFAGCFRRSELVALQVADLAFDDDGLKVRVQRSKTDQEGEGAVVGIPYWGDPETCPVRALRAWLKAAQLTEGPVFRSVNRHGHVRQALDGKDVARIIKRSTLAAGLDPKSYSGHSLRAGLATSAAQAGKSDRSIKRQGRWKSRAMVDRYVRDATLFRDNAASGLR